MTFPVSFLLTLTGTVDELASLIGVTRPKLSVDILFAQKQKQAERVRNVYGLNQTGGLWLSCGLEMRFLDGLFVWASGHLLIYVLNKIAKLK